MPSPDKYTHVTVELSGPLFEVDPEKRVSENIVDALEAIAEYGERYVKSQISGKAGKMPHYTGWTYDHVKGRVRSYANKKWYRHAVVSANTDDMGKADAIRTKAAAAGIEKRWHPFRRATFAVRGHIRKMDLAKGLS